MIFWRLRIDRGVIDVRHLKQREALATIVGGSPGLAEVFDPNPTPLVQFTSDVTDDGEDAPSICLCDNCYIEPVNLAELQERRNTDAERAAHDDAVGAQR